jgi:hypothetical protein
MVLTQVTNQCIEMEKALKAEYGDDFLTNRTKFPITEESLGALASTPDCKAYFGYDALVTEFCGNVDNFVKQVGGGQTCANKTDLNMRSRWCLLDDVGSDRGTRLKTDAKCAKSQLRDKYESVATTFCQQNMNDKWCSCYNLKNKVCLTNPGAAGCGYYKILEDNRGAFGKEPQIQDSKKPGEMIECSADIHGPCPYSPGYTILKDNAHCRPRACDDGYIPENVKSDCQPSYNFCEKDINIQSMSNNDIVIDCNGPNFGSLPDWWDEGGDPDFFKEKRCPPFDKSPLNKLPITCFPKKFNWKNKNVRYLTYGGTSSFSLCCCCIMLILSSLKRR